LEIWKLAKAKAREKTAHQAKIKTKRKGKPKANLGWLPVGNQTLPTQGAEEKNLRGGDTKIKVGGSCRGGGEKRNGPAPETESKPEGGGWREEMGAGPPRITAKRGKTNQKGESQEGKADRKRGKRRHKGLTKKRQPPNNIQLGAVHRP